MIPTLLGITFLVFMLMALAPGGIGAGLQMADGEADAEERAAQEAYLEDRYGLGDPAVVQYVRWLSRISPVKFGVRDQVNPAGDLIRPPRPIDEPPLWDWYVDDLPEADPVAFEFDADHGRVERDRIFRRAHNDYSRQRTNFVVARLSLRNALAEYCLEVDLEHLVSGDGEVDYRLLGRTEPDRTAESWPAVQEAGERLIDVYEESSQSQRRLLAVFLAQPYEEAGFTIIPGFMSVAAPDLGDSFSRGQPVVTLIRDRLPVTLMLNLIAFPIIYLIAIPSGMLAALRRRQWPDVVLGLLFVGLWSIPIVWVGVLCVGFIANDEYLGWFPVAGISDSNAENFTFLPQFTDDGWHRGVLLDTLWHITLPILCMVYGGFAVLSKQTRAAMLDNLNADYVRTAKAKGVARRDIILRHVFRNSLLPIITMFVTVFPAMLSGSVVIEQIFTIPGMGRLVIEAINLRDREVILAVTLIIAIVNITALLLADVLYALADPRISFS